MMMTMMMMYDGRERNPEGREEGEEMDGWMDGWMDKLEMDG
jgi:hypothetical protein